MSRGGLEVQGLSFWFAVVRCSIVIRSQSFWYFLTRSFTCIRYCTIGVVCVAPARHLGYVSSIILPFVLPVRYLH